ncbi:MAG: hypothetical protein LBP26_06290 [Clostridiales bacterium]|jgi:hypothetical protein|nr:hypothetical protein [Clostridiales bacterium]
MARFIELHPQVDNECQDRAEYVRELMNLDLIFAFSDRSGKQASFLAMSTDGEFLETLLLETYEEVAEKIKAVGV